MQQQPDAVRCRLCTTPLAAHARVCPVCGAAEPWIADEPTLNPRVIRLAVLGGAVVLAAVLLLVSGVVMFGPPAEQGERGHSPPGSAAAARDR